MKHPSLIVLKALLQGMPIKDYLNGEMIGLATNNKIGRLYGDEIWTYDWDLGDFISWCEKVPEDELVGLAATMALTEVRSDRKCKTF